MIFVGRCIPKAPEEEISLPCSRSSDAGPHGAGSMEFFSPKQQEIPGIFPLPRVLGPLLWQALLHRRNSLMMSVLGPEAPSVPGSVCPAKVQNPDHPGPPLAHGHKSSDACRLQWTQHEPPPLCGAWVGSRGSSTRHSAGGWSASCGPRPTKLCHLSNTLGGDGALMTVTPISGALLGISPSIPQAGLQGLPGLSSPRGETWGVQQDCWEWGDACPRRSLSACPA